MDNPTRPYQAGNETSSNVVEALDSVDELETDLDQSKGEYAFKLSLRPYGYLHPILTNWNAVNDEVKDFLRWFEREAGYVLPELWWDCMEFLPASKRYINDYISM